MGWGLLVFGMFIVGGIVILGYTLWLTSRCTSAAPVESRDAEPRARNARDAGRHDLEQEHRRTGTG